MSGPWREMSKERGRERVCIHCLSIVRRNVVAFIKWFSFLLSFHICLCMRIESMCKLVACAESDMVLHTWRAGEVCDEAQSHCVGPGLQQQHIWWQEEGIPCQSGG